MALRSAIRSERVDLPHPFVDLAQRRTEFLFSYMTYGDMPMRMVLACAYVRPRVFCASLADVFDNQVPPGWRADLIDLIDATPELDWLLLTKRPENIGKMLAQFGMHQNVWLGTTCEDQAAYDRRWPILRAVPAVVHFISYEPAIGPLRLHNGPDQPDWLICGGESGPGARMMLAAWARWVRDSCDGHGIAFFMKQITMEGRKIPFEQWPLDLQIREFPR